jgi:polyhydroxyalkanoate synthesis regulator phasin
MSKVLRGLVSADHELVAEQAQAIHDSFIMAQKMSDEDRKVLKETLPEAFIKRDQAFHHLSEQLAEAARNEDTVSQLELYQDMQSACLDCHQNHALDRFPEFKSDSLED